MLTCELRGAPPSATAPLLCVLLPDSLEFPRTAAGAPSYLSLTLVNACDEVVEWTAALNGFALSKQRPSAGAFAIESFLPLQPFERRLVSVRFVSEAVGTFAALLVVRYAVAGLAAGAPRACAPVELTAVSGYAQLSWHASVVDFGECNVGGGDDDDDANANANANADSNSVFMSLRLCNTSLVAGVAHVVCSAPSFRIVGDGAREDVAIRVAPQARI